MASSPSMPTPPDPQKTAQAQGAINKETAQYQTQLNMVDQTGPYGSLTYRPTGDQITTTKFDQNAYDADLNHWRKVGLGGTPGEKWGKPDANSSKYTTQINEGPRYEAVTTLSPEQQELADQQFGLQTSLLDVGQGQLNRVNSALSAPMSMKNLPSLQATIPGIAPSGGVSKVGSGPQMSLAAQTPSLGSTFGRGGSVSDVGADDYGDDRLRVEKALMDRMQPYLDERRTAERTRLTNQGFVDPGSEGYQKAIDEVNRQENDARMAAILNAGQEQERLFGMELAGTGFNNQAQAQRFGQNMAAQDFSNNVAQQGFGNQMVARDFNNQAGQQEFQNELAGAGFNNAAQAQIFGQNVAHSQAAAARADHINRARQQAIQERVMRRQMPINEIAALMSGSQVSMPQFVNTPQTGVQAPDYQSQVQQNYAAAIGNYNQQRNANNALMGSIFGLGGTLGSAAIGAGIFG